MKSKNNSFVDLIRHWIPDLKQINNHVFVASKCPFCTHKHSIRHNNRKSFRLNTKLKVFKCYICGMAGKDFNKFKHFLKLYKKYKKIFPDHSLGWNHHIEVYYGCETFEESQLPF